MEEFGQFYERDEVEVVGAIPSGIIRRGLSFFLISIVVLITLACLIKVNKVIPVETRVTSTRPVQVHVTAFGNGQSVQANTESRPASGANNRSMEGDAVQNGKKIVLVKRSFQAMQDSVFSIDPATQIKLFINIGRPGQQGMQLHGQNVSIEYGQLKYLLTSRIIKSYLSGNNSIVYEVDISHVPDSVKYKFLCFKDDIKTGRLLDAKTTILQQLYSNLFNKTKI